jgi:hypothetical protein
VQSKNHFSKRICDIRIINNGWNRKHFKSITLAYGKAGYYKDYIGALESILLGKTYEFLTQLNFELLAFLLDSFGISVPVIRASDYDFTGYKSDLVLDMCVKLGAKKYIFGVQGKNYADVESFGDKGIEVYFQDYVHPVYKQLHGEFVPYLSAIDLLFNEGPKGKNIMMSGNIASI